MRIAVVGTGYVGLVAGVCFAEVGHDVTCVDTDADKVARMRAGISPIYEEGLEELMGRNIAAGRLGFTTDHAAAYRDAAAIFIGVGTPELPDGSADLEQLAAVARQIAETVDHRCLVVVKSTVPVGTNDKVEGFIQDFLPRGDPAGNRPHLEVASNPEFLAQGSAVHDTLQAPRIVIGTESEWAETILREIYAPFGLPIVAVSRRSAEMIKYASNDFLALKISYMNDVANLCELVDADIQDVARGMAYDERIGSRFLNPGVGYGGSCFPKDTRALVWLAKQYGYELRTVNAAIDVNEDQKTVLHRKARRRLITFSGLTVAVLGLTFKPGTDDVREAPALDNVPLLVAEGANVLAYDPVGTRNFSRHHPEQSGSHGSLRYVVAPEDALAGAHACFIFTEWPEIRAIAPERYAALMRTPLVFDGRNLHDPLSMGAAGVEYHSVGRPSSAHRRAT